MARNPSQSLYNLIHALSKAERKHINEAFQTHYEGKNNKYLKLYELLQKQKEFDDDKIKKRLYPGKKVGSSTFATVKNRLYQIILRTLITYDESKTAELNVYNELQKIKVLYKRGLVRECREFVEKLSEKAIQLENPKAVLEINSWKKKLNRISLDIAALENENEATNQANVDAIKQLSNEQRLEGIYYDLFVQRMRKAEKSDSEYKVKLEQTANDLLVEISKTNIYKEKKWILKILNYYYLIINDFENFNTTSKQLYKLVKSNKRDFYENPGDLIPIIASIIQSSSQLGKHDEIAIFAPEFLEIANIKTIGLTDQKRAICSYHLSDFILKFESGDFESGIVRIEQYLAKYSEDYYKPYTLNFYVTFLIIYFSNGNFEEALMWISKINNYNFNHRQDLLVISRCINLIIHYELDNQTLLTSLIRSTDRFIKKNFESSPIEFLLIKLLKRLIEVPFSRKEKTKYLEQFNEEICELSSRQTETRNLNYLLLMAWSQSKIRDLSISEVIKNRLHLLENNTSKTS